jgi:DNA-binding YbaB/EbfC family protein
VKEGITMGGFNLQELMSQAKRQYEVLQKKMEETVVEGSSGGGAVTVKMDGRKQVLSIKIDPDAVKAEDLEMLQDLIAAAINGAGHKVDEAMQSTMGGMLGGLGIPGM